MSIQSAKLVRMHTKVNVRNSRINLWGKKNAFRGNAPTLGTMTCRAEAPRDTLGDSAGNVDQPFPLDMAGLRRLVPATIERMH
jgi:hypothetical protein